MERYLVSLAYPPTKEIGKSARALAYYTARWNEDQQFEYTNFMHNKVPYKFLFVKTGFGFRVHLREKPDVILGSVELV